MTHKLIVLILVLLASACVQKPSFNDEHITAPRALPTVSIMPRVGKDEPVCDLNEEPPCDFTQENYLTVTVEVLSASGKFKEVSLGDHQTDLTIYLSRVIEDDSAGYAGFIGGMVEFMFFMIPVKYKYTDKMTYEVYRGEQFIGKFSYHDYWFFKRSIDAKETNLAKQKDVTKSFALKFLKDIIRSIN